MEKLDLLGLQADFLKGLEIKGKSFNTVKNYRTDLNIFNQFLQNNGRDLEINELTLEQVKEYSNHLQNKYNSPNSIRRRVQALRIFFDWLIERGLYSENPVKKALVSPKVVDPPKPLEFRNVYTLFNYIESQIEHAQGLEKLIYMRNKIIFYLIYGSGLKVSDIESLTESSIFPGNPGRVMVAHPKRDPYTIPLPPGFNQFYLEFKETLEGQKEKDKITFSKLLFNANPYKILKGGLSSRGIEVIFKELSKKLGYQITAKNLRQSCIIKWINQDRPDSQVKEWMGVQPVYSLKAYKDFQKEHTSANEFREIEEKHE
ncbi:MAG: site-specific integrase [Bacteriovoracaceae bacterium]|nr:site-specific integrase [Bacteriovoracaceae bacterium]